MNTLLATFIISIVLLIICLAFIGVKMIFKKNGEFKKQCSSIDPYTGERIGCMCGHSNVLTSDCPNKKHSVLEVDKDLLKEALK
ncbi:MAG: hypothetical protein IJ213_07720 [Bacteroidales bacterium]|nr:hypothetical protein [Bacteroidales bacterium]